MSLQAYEIDSSGSLVAYGRSGTGPPPPPPPPDDPHGVNDFADTNQSGFWEPNGITGLGSNVTRYFVNQGSSTHAAEVNALTKGQTDPYRIMKCGSTASGSPTVGLIVDGVHVQGLPQGHIFGGLDILYANSPIMRNGLCSGCPGSGSGPPGETFSGHCQRTNNPTWQDWVFDGRDDTGVAVAATLQGNSYITNGGTWTRVVHEYANYGFGTAIFQATGSRPFVWNNCTWVNCRKSFNLEDSQCNGPYLHNTCTYGPTPGTGQGEIAQVSSKGFSANLKISDPILTSGMSFPLKVRWYPTEAGGTQVATDMQMFQAGVEVTSDPSKFQLVHY